MPTSISHVCGSQILTSFSKYAQTTKNELHASINRCVEIATRNFAQNNACSNTFYITSFLGTLFIAHATGTYLLRKISSKQPNDVHHGTRSTQLYIATACSVFSFIYAFAITLIKKMLSPLPHTHHTFSTTIFREVMTHGTLFLVYMILMALNKQHTTTLLQQLSNLQQKNTTQKEQPSELEKIANKLKLLQTEREETQFYLNKVLDTCTDQVNAMKTVVLFLDEQLNKKNQIYQRIKQCLNTQLATREPLFDTTMKNCEQALIEEQTTLEQLKESLNNESVSLSAKVNAWKQAEETSRQAVNALNETLLSLLKHKEMTLELKEQVLRNEQATCYVQSALKQVERDINLGLSYRRPQRSNSYYL
jgi:hypothetical protein